MGKTHLATLVTTAALLAVSAPPAQAQLLTYGGYAGLNFSNLDVSQLDPNQIVQSSNGFMLGAWLGVNLSREFTVKLMGYFTQKGAQVSESGGPTGTIRADYFQFPLLIKWNLPIMLLRPHLYAGPAASILSGTGCDVAVLQGTLDCSLDLQTADFSAIIGGGVWLGPILLDVQYDIGFSNINADPSSGVSVKNRTWTILVGFGL
jgi:opacity protein-like surface antigen